ncbi:Acetyltransferase BOT5 [Fusarium oxysporum f. sp. raphani]|uniref:Acetyltransferase BOT5 n=1 Tax=Fusarium oxysporum f. sp. raphani TaxID=96318 RepID=A0A8J5PEF5_FUSOX|nr:Acetyltransferase BOT5 [Fusarium oxysporum f. sp. raphani]
MALQAIRRAVLGQTRQPPNYPTNPTDTVLPVYYFDDTPLLRNCVECWTLRINDPLDAEMLRESLSRVIARPGWRKLGGRIRMNSKEKLEIHVPETFTSERPALGFHHDTFDVSIDAHPLASKFPHPTPDRPSIQDSRSDFTALGVPPGTPLSLNDYLKSDYPQLTLHVVSFTDATLVSLCWPHITVDATSLRDLGIAWSLVLAGRESEVLPMLSAGEDPMAHAGDNPAFTKPYALEKQQVKGRRMYLFPLFYVLDLLRWRTLESKILFLPRKNVEQLRNQALDSLGKTSSPPFISEGDVIVAWLSIVVASALFPQGSRRPFTIGNAYDLRGRAPSLFPIESGKGAYVQNAVLPCWTIVPAKSMHNRGDSTLGTIALALRNSLKEQTTEASIHALARLTRVAGLCWSTATVRQRQLDLHLLYQLGQS